MTHAKKIWLTLAVVFLSAVAGIVSKSPAWWSPLAWLSAFDIVFRLFVGFGAIALLIVIPTAIHSYDLIKKLSQPFRLSTAVDLIVTVSAIAVVWAPVIALLRWGLGSP